MRGTAFSIVGLATGGSLLVGNLVAGKLMDVTYRNGLGHIGAFLWGLSATCLATFALVYLSIMGDVDGPTATPRGGGGGWQRHREGQGRLK